MRVRRATAVPGRRHRVGRYRYPLVVSLVVLLTLAGLLSVLRIDTAATVTTPAAARYRGIGVADDCVEGRPDCVGRTLAQMRQRFEPLGRACDHHAAFALAYLRGTQSEGWASEQSGVLADPAWVNHEVVLLAAYYFAAYDYWAAGPRSVIPASWLIALDAARDHRVSGTGDVLLGMNANIGRDLPFVLATIGLTRPDGTSRKPDYDRVSESMRAAIAPLMAEESKRFDPYSFNSTGVADGWLHMFVSWREHAWRDAERLVVAPDMAMRTIVAGEIEARAAADAASISMRYAYAAPSTISGPRDLHCARHNADAPGAYPFGTPPAY
jgi:Family of unknown function (DUF5995)